MRFKGFVTRVGLLLMSLMCFIIATLIVARLAISYPVMTSSFLNWFNAYRFGWFLWRMAIYAFLGWNVWRIYKAPNLGEKSRTPLMRMVLVSLVFILLCEYALFSQGNADDH